MKLNKKVALVLTAILAVSSMSVSAFAADSTLDGEASVGFTSGGTTIVPPDPDDEDDANLKKVSTTDIYFGEHKTSAKTQKIESRASAAHPHGKEAGFMVEDPNGEGWTVKVGVTGFKASDNSSVLDTFDMQLNNTYLKTSVDNEGAPAPVASNIKINPSNGGGLGDAVTILQAEPGKGVGTWGGNWEGELTVLPGKANEGNGVAVMAWSLEVTP